jgi:predicted nucleotidyltransferase
MTIVEGAIMALTLLERKKARVEEIRAGFTRLREELAGYGATHGGRFLIFGSAATGRFHYESDIDIIVDFKGPPLRSALDFVESACARLRLKADIRPISWCTPAFLERVSAGAIVLP